MTPVHGYRDGSPWLASGQWSSEVGLWCAFNTITWIESRVAAAAQINWPGLLEPWPWLDSEKPEARCPGGRWGKLEAAPGPGPCRAAVRFKTHFKRNLRLAIGIVGQFKLVTVALFPKASMSRPAETVVNSKTPFVYARPSDPFGHWFCSPSQKTQNLSSIAFWNSLREWLPDNRQGLQAYNLTQFWIMQHE